MATYFSKITKNSLCINSNIQTSLDEYVNGNFEMVLFNIRRYEVKECKFVPLKEGITLYTGELLAIDKQIDIYGNLNLNEYAQLKRTKIVKRIDGEYNVKNNKQSITLSTDEFVAVCSQIKLYSFIVKNIGNRSEIFSHKMAASVLINMFINHKESLSPQDVMAIPNNKDVMKIYKENLNELQKIFKIEIDQAVYWENTVRELLEFTVSDYLKKRVGFDDIEIRLVKFLFSKDVVD